MNSSFPLLTLLEKVRDSQAWILAVSGATRVFRRRLMDGHRRGALILPALVLCAALLGSPDAHAAVVELVALNTSDNVSSDTLRGAILQAHKISNSSQVIIRLKPGATYKIGRATVFNGKSTEGTSIDPEYGDFDITRSLTIDGRGAIIDAQYLGRIFDFKAQISVTISNLTLRSGGDGNSQAGLLDGGGAVRISNGANVMFKNVAFLNNVLTGPGSSNSERRGGAIYVADAGGSWVSLTDCRFEWNGVRSANSGQAAAGGAIYQVNGMLTVARTRFVRCWAMQAPGGASSSRTARGGAIYAAAGNVEVTESEFEENTARSADGSAHLNGEPAEGGAIYAGNGVLTFAVKDTQFRRNSAKAGRAGDSPPTAGSSPNGASGGTASGGAVFLRRQNRYAEFRRCEFEDNFAFAQRGGYSSARGGGGGEARGGALFIEGGPLSLVDTRFLGNFAVGGDGGFTERTSFELVGPRGGSGGAARGGAVYAGSEHGVYVSGTLEIEVSGTETNLTATALFAGNRALGGSGRPGRGNQAPDGVGGDGAGGGIWLSGGKLELKNVLAHNNSAQGGAGANVAGQPRFNDNDASEDFVIVISKNPSGPDFVGRGGSNGDARGGFLYAGGGEALIEGSRFAFNGATGGRFESRVILKVPPEFENGSTWSVSRPDRVIPFVAGSGGKGAPGGDGGDALGGAIYTGGRLIVRRSGVMGNQAYGARGGPGGAAVDVESGVAPAGGVGGSGGWARGGGIIVTSSGSFDIRESILVGNIAMAGTGGPGGQGGKGGKYMDPEAESDCETGCGGNGGEGGEGGEAMGGGLYSDRYSSDPAQHGRMVACYVAKNQVIAGDGFYGGHGGTGAGFRGGGGGKGGRGGHAWGGGIYASVLYGERVTVDLNLVTSGWGGAGGHGGGGGLIGGFGSPGGTAGNAAGGGVYIGGSTRTDNLAHLILCTVSNNRLFAGRGGQGGFGGPAWDEAGDGAAGGANGIAQGGGVFAASGGAPVKLSDSTVARNIIDTGDGGFAGLGGPGADELDDAPVRYHAATPAEVVIDGRRLPGPPIVDGAFSLIRDEQGFPIGMAPRVLGYQSPTNFSGRFPLHNASPSDSVSQTEKWIADAVTVTVGGVGHGTVAAVTSAVGVWGLLTTGSSVFGSTAAAGAGSAAGAGVSAAAGGSAAAAVPIAAFGIPAVTVGMVAATFITYMVATEGDFQASVSAMLGQPGDVYRYSLVALIANPRDEDEEEGIRLLDPIPGRNGAGGQYRAPEGSGVYGNVSLSGTLIGDNSAYRRTRPYKVKPLSSKQKVLEFTEVKSQLGNVSDVAGGVASKGGNFISIAPSGFATSTHDIFGSAANPKVARVASGVANHGGDVPTLKLLPGSPARGAIPASFGSSKAQNGFSWSGTRDIGAWGAPPNRAPAARTLVFRIAPGGSLKFSASDLRKANPDPDGDDVSVASDTFVTTTGTKSTAVENNVRVYRYTPPAGFVGIMEVLHYHLTDGQYQSNLGRVVVHVVPAESSLECPPFGNGRTIPIASEPVGGTTVTAEYIELPESARSDHNFTGPFTVEFWMRLGRDWVHQHEPLITKGDSAWRIQRGSNTDKLAFGITGLDPLSLYSNREIKDRNWHHVAAVYDGRYKLLYIDGELDAWTEVTGTPAVNNQPVWIGSNSERSTRRFRGHMDEVRIWNQARSAVEIRENFVRTLTGYEDGLLTYYTFDEPIGWIVYNFAKQGTSAPGLAPAFQGGHAVWRPQLLINRSEDPINWTFGSRVVGSYLFHNESVLDGANPAATEADDLAIATNIWPLLPGDLASDANISSYNRGINGVIIDIASPLDPNDLSLEDFEFAFGNDDDPDAWAPAEPPASILVRPGAGVCGSTRVTLAWADHLAGSSVPNRAAGNGWLRVTVRANERTGLHHDDVFLFGSAIGDSDDDDFHLPDLRVQPYREAGDGASGPAFKSLPEETTTATVPLLIRQGFGGRIQLTIPAITGEGDDIIGRILTAPTPTGPWSELPGGLITNLGNQERTIQVVPDQQAAFYRLQID